MFQHRTADRIPVFDEPWGSTLARWRREGLPAEMDFRAFFGLDYLTKLILDNSPRYDTRTVEETDRYITRTTDWGATIRNWKLETSTPEFLDFTITGPDQWAQARKRLTMDRSRINWDRLKREYPAWRKDGHWLEMRFRFGFDFTHSFVVGTERLLIALVEQSEWCMDIFGAQLDLDIQIAEAMLAEGYAFDCVSWPDDLGYKLNQFMSVDMFRELVKPTMKRCVQWAHSKGMFTRLHSCGCINPFIPDFVQIGIDCLNPLEVKAGVDPVAVKRQFGDRLALHGGINAALWDKPDQIEAELRRVVPTLKENGGYIFSTDHSVPSCVGLEEFRRITTLAKQLGAYE